VYQRRSAAEPTDNECVRRRVEHIISARCHIYISRLCYDVSVRLSVTEVHWRIIANLGFKFPSHFTAHCGRRAACGRIISHHPSQCKALLLHGGTMDAWSLHERVVRLQGRRDSWLVLCCPSIRLSSLTSSHRRCGRYQWSTCPRHMQSINNLHRLSLSLSVCSAIQFALTKQRTVTAGLHQLTIENRTLPTL